MNNIFNGYKYEGLSYKIYLKKLLLRITRVISTENTHGIPDSNIMKS